MKLNFSSLGSLEGFSGFEIKFKIVVIAEDERVEFFPFFWSRRSTAALELIQCLSVHR